MFVRLSTAVFVTLCLAACASFIGQSALHPPMLNLSPIPQDDYPRIGYQAHRHCAPELPCLAYSVAPAYDNQGRTSWAAEASAWQEQAPLVSSAMEVSMNVWAAPEKTLADHRRRVAMRYRIELDTTRGKDQVELWLDGEVPRQPRGTYVLVHGFRTNKESMFFVAESMRFAGYDVVTVDMFGHGESEGRFTFNGEPDARAISDLLDQQRSLNQLNGPIHVAGMSMGGAVVTHLANQRDDIQSLMLLSPMLEFVDAFVDAGRAYTRSAHLVPRSSLRKGARYALAEAGAEQEDTSVVQRVAELNLPVLIFASAIDRISPLAKLQEIAQHSEQVELHVVQPRTHHGMILWDTEDFGRWLAWLDTIGRN